MVGTTTVVREEFEDQYGLEEKNYLEEKDIKMIQDIPSMPFMIEFNLPIVKVACADTNYALLAANG